MVRPYQDYLGEILISSEQLQARIAELEEQFMLEEDRVGRYGDAKPQYWSDRVKK